MEMMEKKMEIDGVEREREREREREKMVPKGMACFSDCM